MSYTINLTDGAIFAVIPDGTINTTSSMVLVGKNYAGYGEFLNENYIHLLENGSNTTAPGAPLTGQLWWDKTNGVLRVYSGTTFKAVSAATSAPVGSPPPSPVQGDLWYDTTNAQLKVYSGTAWLLVGPAFTAGTGETGAIVDTIVDISTVSHVVIKFFVSNTLIAIMSKDPTFTPQVAIPGFATVSPGMQMSTATPGYPLRGNVVSTNIVVGSATPITGAALTSVGGPVQLSPGTTAQEGVRVTRESGYVTLTGINNDNNAYNGIKLGTAANAAITVTTTGSVGFGTTTPAALLDVNGNARIGGTFSATGITNLNADGVGNIGASGAAFNTVFAKATSAQYADVAERFAADTELLPGTVVELGGSAEITAAQTELSEQVFGVISTRAAYLMNSLAGDDASHPPVAMTGRVPVRVVGAVRKGDRLVSAGNGVARAAQPGEATHFNTIGRSLVDKLSTDAGLVEAIVIVK
jgi:hypothetical protein